MIYWWYFCQCSIIGVVYITRAKYHSLICLFFVWSFQLQKLSDSYCEGVFPGLVLDLSGLLGSPPPPAVSSLRSLCGYLGSQLGKIWWCGNFYGHRQQGRTFSCWNMTGTQAARRHRSFVSNRGKGNSALKARSFSIYLTFRKYWLGENIGCVTLLSN